jgi:hypothetical protein
LSDPTIVLRVLSLGVSARQHAEHIAGPFSFFNAKATWHWQGISPQADWKPNAASGVVAE